DRRRPLVLDRRVQFQARRDPRPPESLRGHANPNRHLYRPLHRAVRPLPQPDAVHGQDRDPGPVPPVDQRAAGGADQVNRGNPVTTFDQPVGQTAGQLRNARKGSVLAAWLSSTDHKIIGHLYLITSFGFFLAGGVMALLMRIQLLGPDLHVVSDQQYNELFTMHGTIMLLLFATPLFVGFANEIFPLQIGGPDVALPPLDLLSYYMFAFGGLILL